MNSPVEMVLNAAVLVLVFGGLLYGYWLGITVAKSVASLYRHRKVND